MLTNTNKIGPYNKYMPEEKTTDAAKGKLIEASSIIREEKRAAFFTEEDIKCYIHFSFQQYIQSCQESGQSRITCGLNITKSLSNHENLLYNQFRRFQEIFEPRKFGVSV